MYVIGNIFLFKVLILLYGFLIIKFGIYIFVFGSLIVKIELCELGF